MKTKILLLMLLVGVVLNVSAQVDLGDAVVTRSSPVGQGTTAQVVQIFPVGNTAGGGGIPLQSYGNNWGLPVTTPAYPNWTAENLGQVFGIAINTNTATGSPHPNPLIYVSVSQNYPRTVASYHTYPNGGHFVEYYDPTTSQWGPIAMPEHTTLIWELDPSASGNVPRALVLSDPTGLMLNNINHMFNRGSGIGNICFDPDNNQIFATNSEDGRIYRIRASDGVVLSRYDPFNAFTGCSPCTNLNAKAVGTPERLWGIGYSKGKLYFSRWVEDMGVGNRIAPGQGQGYGNPDANEVWTVDILPPSDPNWPGDFAGVNNAIWGDYTPVTLPTRVVDLSINPVRLADGTVDDLGQNLQYSNPISDIEFSEDGNIMLLAERTMSGFYFDAQQPDQIGIAGGWAHKARLLRYERNGLNWNQWTSYLGTNYYYVGNCSDNNHQAQNCDGGTDFGYIDVTVAPSTQSGCEGIVWATGDAIKHPYNTDGIHSSQWVYGIAGMPVAGNLDYCNLPPPLSQCVNNTSIYQDLFDLNPDDNGGIPPGFKAQPGDVDVFRESCCDIVITGVTTNACNSGSNGTIDIMVTGTGPFTYQWADGPMSQDRLFPPLTPGDYTVNVTGANCTASASFTVGESSPLVITETAHTDICWEVTSGSVTIVATGGTPPYTYSWTAGNNPNSATNTGLTAGIHTVNVYDDNLCTGSYSVTITNCCPLVGPMLMLGPPPYCAQGVISFIAQGLGYGILTLGSINGPKIDEGYLNTTFFANNELLVGSNTVCLRVYSSDPTPAQELLPPCWTNCIPVIANDCSCNASITPDDDHYCIGDQITLTLSGGANPGLWGVVAFKNSGGAVLRVEPAVFLSTTSTLTITPNLLTATEVCLYVYTSFPTAIPNQIPSGWCDYDCAPIMVETCDDGGCPENIVLDINHTCVGATCTFFNDYEFPFPDLNPPFGNGSTNPMPDWITWSVNGQVEAQTTATGTFDYPFTDEGTYVVCMQAAYLIEHGDHTLCCYYDDCEVIHIRGCELWKAEAGFTITYGDPNYREVTVDYTGDFTGDDTWEMTIIWNFGDGTIIVSNDGDPVTHPYNADYTGQICAQIIWSIGPWDGSNPEACCCVTEICKDVEATPCQGYKLTLGPSPTDQFIRFSVDPLPPTTISWYVNNNFTGVTGSLFDYMGMPCTDECVCARFDVISVGEPYTCNVCHNSILPLIENSRIIRYYPNPTNETTTVELEALAGELALIEVYDFTGRIMLNKVFENLSYGKNQLPINLAALSSGMYQMRVIIGGETKVVKVIKD